MAGTFIPNPAFIPNLTEDEINKRLRSARSPPQVNTQKPELKEPPKDVLVTTSPGPVAFENPEPGLPVINVGPSPIMLLGAAILLGLLLK